MHSAVLFAAFAVLTMWESRRAQDLAVRPGYREASHDAMIVAVSLVLAEIIMWLARHIELGWS